MKEFLCQLQANYGVFDKPIEAHFDKKVIWDTKVHSTGLCTHFDGVEIVASAITLNDYTNKNSCEKAFFELVERASAVRFMQSYQKLESNALPNSKSFKVSLSNGIACHHTEKYAFENAKCELIERDRILRHWLAKKAPKKLELSAGLSRWSADYDMYLVSFESDVPYDSVNVIGIFGFPKKTGLHFCLGFGAHLNFEIALKKAQSEFIQRFVFLEGEPIDSDLVESPTAYFHQEYYLRETNYNKIRLWLMSDNSDAVIEALPKVPPREIYDIHDLRWWNHTELPIFAYKVTSRQRLPLYFGQGYYSQKFGIEPLDFHPIC
jgi:hypothetical protein